MLPIRHVLAGIFVALMVCRAVADTPAEVPSPAKRVRQLREEAKDLRSRAAEDYRTAEAKCYGRFLVNRCIDDAKAERLTLVLRARRLEAEARRLDLAERVRTAEGKKGGAVLEASPPAQDVETTEFRAADSRAWVVRRSANTSHNKLRANQRAARRAEAAQHDRERYDARIRELEEKKKRDADGR